MLGIHLKQIQNFGMVQTWTEIADLAAGRAFAGNAGHTATNAMAATGYNYPSAVNTTEEWTAADFEIKTVTTS